MCQYTVGKVVSSEKDKIIVEIKGNLKKMISPFMRVEKGDIVFCVGNYIIEKDESGMVCK
jgi:hypothetical protein